MSFLCRSYVVHNRSTGCSKTKIAQYRIEALLIALYLIQNFCIIIEALIDHDCPVSDTESVYKILRHY